MIISDDKKALINEEFEYYKTQMYANFASKEERQKFGAFYTPAKLSIRMAEKFENLDGTILDPCVGHGALLMTCILAGANPNNCYGVELNPDTLKQCRKHLCSPSDFKRVYNEDIEGNKYLNGKYVPIENIHQGNALNNDCFNFVDAKNSPDYKEGFKYSFSEIGEIGKVDIINTVTGAKKFKFGVR